MPHRRDLLRLFASSALALSAGPVLAQVPAKAQRKGARAGLGMVESLVEEILEEHQIAGATLAIAKDGRLVLAKGFGLADVEARKPATAETLFSIASVTKPISAVATLKLVEQGKLKLEARLVEIFADLKPLDGPQAADPRFREITIHQILYHGAGLANAVPPIPGEGKAKKKEAEKDQDDDGGDFDVTAEKVIKVYRMAMSRPLEFAPGTDHRYSNVGFLLLQLVVERTTGQPYETWVREHILAPMGITRMVMETEAFIPGETRRYGIGPSGLRRLTGHKASNWLATPTDMVRFLTGVSGARGKPILPEKLHKLMLALPPAPIKPGKDGRHVGLGWDAVQLTPEGPRYSKNGGKAGVRAWLEHLPNGVDWAFMLNTGEPPGKGPPAMTELARKGGEALLGVKRWPEADLFKSAQK
jgi:CubicO group peptidase (beta-lactamase class C family)